jgi:hypothetical protein
MNEFLIPIRCVSSPSVKCGASLLDDCLIQKYAYGSVSSSDTSIDRIEEKKNLKERDKYK